jgi:hypothetical protein
LASAQEAKKLKLLFSDRPEDPKPRPYLTLRPNLEQAVFLYVQNANDTTEDVKVELRSGGIPLPDGTQSLKVEGTKPVQVVFAKAPAAPGEKPPVLAPLKGPFEVRLLDPKNTVLDEVKLDIARPSEYVDVTAIKFDPTAQEGTQNRLFVRVRAKETFAGPRCRVELVLRPDRIPGLVPGQKKEGTYAGYLTRPGDEVVLLAENLQFLGKEQPAGLVYLTIDGYERAFTFSTTFPREGIVTEPQRIDIPVLRLNAPRFSAPTPKYLIGLEVDNTKKTERVDLSLLGLGVDKDDKVVEQATPLMQFTGDRRQLVLFAVPGPGGAMLFKPEVQDWSTVQDLSEVFGKRTLRLRLLDDQDKPVQVRNSATNELTEEILEPMVLDGTKPLNVKFIDFPPKLPRGAPLPLKAVGTDPESGISRVVFYSGTPPADGKLPPTAVVAEGKPVGAPDVKYWVAELPVNTEKKGIVEVTVQFTNGAGLSASDTVKIQLVDPPAPAPAAAATAKLASIEGTVTQAERPQPNLQVNLTDAQGVAKGSATTDAQGKYTFKDVVPGSYKVSTVKTGDATKGDAAVSVIEGQKKTGVDIKLAR